MELGAAIASASILQEDKWHALMHACVTLFYINVIVVNVAILFYIICVYVVVMRVVQSLYITYLEWLNYWALLMFTCSEW